MSTYFGSITMVLKFPFTSAASTKGLLKYSGLGTATAVGGGGDVFGGGISGGGKVEDVGVVDLFGRCTRVIDRPMELKKDMGGTEANQSRIKNKQQ